MMMQSIVKSISTLCWAILMLMLVQYIFGLCFLQAVSTYLSETKPENVDPEVHAAIEKYWSSVYASLVTLYMAVTGGSDWEPLADPIRLSGWLYYWLFLFYIAFCMITVLNVLTGMIVDSTMEASESDEKDHEVEFADHEYVTKIRQFFGRSDVDC